MNDTRETYTPPSTPPDQRLVAWAGAAAIISLIVLSIVGAFLGAATAKKLFNSPPLAAFWFAWGGLLAASLVLVPAARRCPGLLAAHLGAALIIAGALWGSRAGHAVAERLLGVHKAPLGVTVIHEGSAASAILDPDTGMPAALPFQIQVRDTPWRLMVVIPPADPAAPMRWQDVDWAVGRKSPLALIGGSIQVLQYLPHAAPSSQGVATQSTAAATDARSPVPAMQFAAETSRRGMTAWLLPRGDDPVAMAPLSPITGGSPEAAPAVVLMEPRERREAQTEISILAGGKEAARATVAPNAPLRFGGYHIYHLGGGTDDSRPYAALKLVSDTGLTVVLAGLALMTLGIFHRLWLRPAWRYLRKGSK